MSNTLDPQDGSGDAPTGPPTIGPPRLPGPDDPGALFTGPTDDPDRYQLLDAGITGGEGTTWRAGYRGGLQQPLTVAVKRLDRPRSTRLGGPTEQDRQRWTDQVQLLLHLRLTHVVTLHDVFTGPPPHPRGLADPSADNVYLVMDWIDGPTLAELIDGHAASPATIAQRAALIVDSAAAVTELHTASQQTGNLTVHRDIKPSNCIVHPARGVVLIDVSTMRLAGDGYDPAGLHTAAYTAPEVLRNPRAPRQPAADRYALGALAVYCLTGTHPPPAGTAVAELVAAPLVRVLRHAAVTNADTVAAHLLTMLDAHPGRRPTDATAWADRLQRTLTPTEPAPPSRRRRRVAAAALAVCVLVALGAAATQHWRPINGTTPRAGSTPTTAPASAGPASPGTSASGTASATGPSGPASATAAVTTPTPSRATSAPTTPTVRTASTGAISTPADGADVPQCAYFAGTAQLAPGATLILVMHNLDNGDQNRYVELVYGWDNPATLDTWRGAQYFGKDGDAGGQRYKVELAAVDINAVRAAKATGSGAAINNLTTQSTALASRTLHRVAGTGPPDHCPGP